MQWFLRVLAIVCLGLSGCVPPAPGWSPDGKWVAYLSVAEIDAPPILLPGWFLEAPPAVAKPAPVATATPPRSGKARRYRLWISKPDGTESRMLIESTEPISSPAWSPDSKALTVSRITTHQDGHKLLECLIVRGPGQNSVLFSEQIDRERTEVDRLPEFVPAWSPDGSSIATAHMAPAGIAVIRVSTRQIVTIVENGFLPSWSPDGSRLAYLRRGEGDSDSVGVVEVRKGQARRLLEVGKGDQAPLWTRDGQSLVVTARHARQGVGQPNAWGDDAVLLRVQVDTGQIEPVRALTAERQSPMEAATSSVTFVMDREADNLLYAISTADAPSYVTWFRPREGSTFRKFPVVDLSLPIGGLSLAPNGRTLALRMGKPSQNLTPVLFDLEKNTALILAPDQESRQAWMAVLGRTIQGLIALSRDGLENRQPAMVSRSPIPLPCEIDENSEIAFRMRRIARLGRPLLSDPEIVDAPLRPEAVRAVDEATLLFEYLNGDFTAALAAVTRLEEGVGSIERNLALLALRTQVALASGDLESYHEAFSLLESVERPRRSMIEYQGGVARLVPVRGDRPPYSLALKTSRAAMESEESEQSGIKSLKGPFRAEPARIPFEQPFRVPSPFDPMNLMVPR